MNAKDATIDKERRLILGRWSRRTIAITAITSAAVIGGGVALAAWSVSGSGNATAAAGTATPLVIAAGTSPSSLLVPGGSADVNLVITNNNKANVSISALTLSNTGIAGYTDNTFATPKTGCNTTGVTWATTSKSISPAIVVAGNGGTYTLTLTNGASMDTTSDDGCQSAVFKMPVSAVTAVVTSTAADAPNNGSR